MGQNGDPHVKMTVVKKINLLVILAILGVFAFAVPQWLTTREQLWSGRGELLKSQVQSTISILASLQKKVDAGEMTLDEAKIAGRNVIRTIRYGNNDYLAVLDSKGVSRAHPNPDIEDKNYWENKDSNGFLFNQDVIQKAMSGGGFTRYSYKRLNADTDSPKYVYSAYFKPWDWVVFTGVYVDDIQAALRADLIKSASWFGLLILLLAGGSTIVSRGITRPLNRLRERMVELASGRLDVEIAGQDRSDELGAMAKAVQVFKDAALERQRLEQEAREARQAQALSRDRQAAIDQAKAEDLRAFVHSVEVGFDRLAEGDLTIRMDGQVAPEFEPIRQRFNVSVAQLEDTIGSVVGAVGTMRSGLSEITVSTEDLARRTEQQAASLEETVAALSEVVRGVGDTVERADDAQSAATLAQSEASKGGDVVKQAIAAMTAIEASSGRISNIISVIDQIAFQTNLLALNAGVEAARAGDAGRGFAVVAQEVRGLAQRSADAAKEIKTLISASTDQVSHGVELVAASGSSLERIVSQVEGVSAIITEMARLAREQSISLKEVSVAADQMDKVTQQNAAMVEETTAAALALSGDTDQLASLAERFRTGKISGRGNAAPSATARRRSSHQPVKQLRSTSQTKQSTEEWAEF